MKTTRLLFFLLASGVIAAQTDESKCCCTTYDTSLCLAKIHASVEKDLNQTYSEALHQLADSPDDIANLKDAERKWIQFRDAACKSEYALWGGGSGGPNARTTCLIRLTRVRTADIGAAYLRCKPHCKQ